MASKYDAVWKEIFDVYNIESRINSGGYIELSAEEINGAAPGYEVRLLNHKLKNLNTISPVFEKNNFSLLPVAKKQYAIGPFDAYQKVSYDQSIETRKAPDIDLLSSAGTMYLRKIEQETQMAAYAHFAGIIDDIVGENVKRTLHGGSMGSGNFRFKIKDSRYPQTIHELLVDGAGIEIDCCSEGKTTVVLQEYKPQPLDNFIIRQLYYPYRKLRKSTSKDIYLMFITLSKNKDIMHFFTYIFEDDNDYNSLSLVEQRDYEVYQPPFLEKQSRIEDL